MDLFFGLVHLEVPVFGFFYHDYLLYLSVLFLLLAVALLSPAVPNEGVARFAEHIWFAAALDVLFELALIAIAAIGAVWFGEDWRRWLTSSRVELVTVLVLLVFVIAVVRRVVDGWIDGGGGGKGPDDGGDPPGGGGSGVAALLGLRFQLLALRGPLTPLSSRSALIKAMRQGTTRGKAAHAGASDDAQARGPELPA